MVEGISQAEESIIKYILAPYFALYNFYFYGSRVKGKYSKVSDLDILIKGNAEMPADVMEQLKQQFDESSLPYIVHFSDYYKIDQSFYKKIEKDLVFVVPE